MFFSECRFLNSRGIFGTLLILQANTTKAGEDVAAIAVAPEVIVDDGDAEGDEESDLEQIESAEPSGDASSSSRDATPQLSGNATPQQGDPETPATDDAKEEKCQEQEAGPSVVEPQFTLALKTAYSLVIF